MKTHLLIYFSLTSQEDHHANLEAPSHISSCACTRLLRHWPLASAPMPTSTWPPFTALSGVASSSTAHNHAMVVSAGIGMLIEFWKITKVMNISIDTSSGAPRLKIENRSSYVQSNTKQWDDEATKYMMVGLFPCVIGYFIYSLIYEKHKNWCALAACSTREVCSCKVVLIRMCIASADFRCSLKRSSSSMSEQHAVVWMQSIAAVQQQSGRMHCHALDRVHMSCDAGTRSSCRQLLALCLPSSLCSCARSSISTTSSSRCALLLLPLLLAPAHLHLHLHCYVASKKCCRP